MLQYLVPMTIFSLTIVTLSLIVLVVRTRLTERKVVTVTVNDTQNMKIETGVSLLETLALQSIELPAACGGRGLCGQCRLHVHPIEALSPTEANHINRRDASEGIRLACMYQVRHNLEVTIPQALLRAHRLECAVVSNRNVSTYLKQLILKVPEHESFTFRAGDYVVVEAPPGEYPLAAAHIDQAYEREWQRLNLGALIAQIQDRTGRAYSLANPPSENKELMLIVRLATPPAGTGAPPGEVSSYIFSLKPGDSVTVSGPFGDFHAIGNDGLVADEMKYKEMVLIGGGVGIAPLRSIILDELTNKQFSGPISLWYGARNAREVCFFEEFSTLAEKYANFSYHVALSEPETKESWRGPVGFIHNVVYEQHLAHSPNPEQAEYYLCGPPLMSAATLAMLEDIGVDSEHIHFDDFGGANAD